VKAGYPPLRLPSCSHRQDGVAEHNRLLANSYSDAEFGDYFRPGRPKKRGKGITYGELKNI